MQPSQPAVTATPNPQLAMLLTQQAMQPLPTYADPELRMIVAQNTLYALELESTATQQEINRVGTSTAVYMAQMFEAATQQAVDTDSSMARATQEAQQAIAQTTQQAVAAVSTHTAIAVYAEQQAAAAEATIVRATEQAAAADQAVLLAQEQEARAEEARYETDFTIRSREAQFTFWNAFCMGTLLLFVVGGSIAIYLSFKFGYSLIGVEVRRRLVMLEAGVTYDLDREVWQPLPSSTSSLPAPQPNRDERLKKAIKRGPGWEELQRLRRERNLRAAWNEQATRFLRWSECPDGTGEPVGFNRRRFLALTGVTQDTYYTMLELLEKLGMVEKGNPNNPRSPWIRARDERGQEQTVSQLLRSTRWGTSYEVPSSALPNIPVPPMTQSYSQTTPNQQEPTSQQGPTTKTIENGPENTNIAKPSVSWNMASPVDSIKAYQAGDVPPAPDGEGSQPLGDD